MRTLTAPPLLLSSYWKRVNSSVRGTVSRSDGFVYDFDEAFSKAVLKNFASQAPTAKSAAASLVGGAEFRTWLQVWGSADGPAIKKLPDGQLEVSWSGTPADWSVSVPVHPWDQQERVKMHYVNIAFAARYRPVSLAERRAAVQDMARQVGNVFGRTTGRGVGSSADQADIWDNFTALGREPDVLRRVGVVLAKYPLVEIPSLLAELQTGRDLADLERYFEAGVESVRDIHSIDATFGFDIYSEYAAVGFAQLPRIQAFIAREIDAKEARAWGPLGYDIKPEHIVRYIEKGLTAADVRGYLNVGIEQSKDIIAFAAEGVAPEFASAIYESPDTRRARLRAERSAAGGQTP